MAEVELRLWLVCVCVWVFVCQRVDLQKLWVQHVKIAAGGLEPR